MPPEGFEPTIPAAATPRLIPRGQIISYYITYIVESVVKYFQNQLAYLTLKYRVATTG
jgi:hypothetical protein